MSQSVPNLSGLLSSLFAAAHPQPETRPAVTGEAFRHQFIPAGPVIQRPLARPVGEASRFVFNDLLEAFPRGVGDLGQVVDLRRQLLAADHIAAAAEVSRVTSWLYYREADVEMALTYPQRAAIMMMDAQTHLDIWWQWAKAQVPGQQDAMGAMMQEWRRLEDSYRNTGVLIDSSRRQLRGELQVSRPDQGHFIFLAGVRLYEAADQLHQQGFPSYSHHVLHYGTEEAFSAAAEAFDRNRDRKNADRARSFYQGARDLHDKTHSGMFWSSDPMVGTSEDGQGILSPPELIVRRRLQSLASALALDEIDPQVVLASCSNDEMTRALAGVLDIFEAVVHAIQGLQGDADESERTIALINVLTGLQQMETGLMGLPSSKRPAYLGKVLQAFAGHYVLGSFPWLAVMQMSRVQTQLIGFAQATLETLLTEVGIGQLSEKARRQSLSQQIAMASTLEGVGLHEEAHALLVGADHVSEAYLRVHGWGWNKFRQEAKIAHQAFHLRNPGSSH